MRFGIRRLGAGGDNGRRYHLFDEAGQIKVVADHGSPWLAAEPDGRVRFARPSGDMVASMELPRPALPSSRGWQPLNYVIIVNHAVYAIINEYHDSNRIEDPLSTYFRIEVEGRQWLGLKQPEGTPYFSLYAEVPADLAIYDEPSAAPLPEPVGRIYRSAGEYDFTAEMAAGRLADPPLILLALLFLIERPAEAGMRS